MQISLRENYIGRFGDKRLDKRANNLSSLLYFSGSSSIHGSTLAEAEQKAAYRFLSNKKVREELLIQAAIEKSRYVSDGKDVLVIQDTTEINLQDHHKRLQRGKGVGLTGNNKDKGFFVHGSLVLDGEQSMVLGFSNIELWHRRENKLDKNERRYKCLATDKKESNKWIKAAQQSKEHLASVRTITFIEDREGDIFEQFATIPDERTHLLIRSCNDRNLSDGGKLFSRLARQPVSGTYTINIVKDIRQEVKKRAAQVAVRFCKVGIARPARFRGTKMQDNVDLYAVEVREVKGPAKGAVWWRLLTTHPVSSYQQAVDIVNKYRQRWHIEQLFRLMKKQGFHIESSELETGWAVRKLTIMILNSALRVMQLRLAYNNEEGQAIEEVFNKEEIKCLKAANDTLQGNTQKMTNNHNPEKLSWANWVIARLGGWKPYDNKRPPGPIILKRGLDRFTTMYKGWKLALRKDVS